MRRIQETVEVIVGLEVIVGAIRGLLGASAEAIGLDNEAVHREVCRANLVPPHETSTWVGGANWCARSFATELTAYYELDPS